MQAFNDFGIAGGANQYLIDLSYEVIPRITSDIGPIIILISEKMMS